METVLSLLTDYGVWLLFIGTFLSCLALPVPASLMMLVGGGFAASGDMSLWTAGLAAWGGAVSGDQTGYGLGRIGGARLDGWLARHPARSRVMRRARGFMTDWGGAGVFLSRWLVSPLGPYVNFAGGATRMHWPRFLVWGMLGEAAWVIIYTGLGYGFSGHILAVADIAGNVSGLLAAGCVTLGLGVWLWRRSGKIHRGPHI